MKFEAAWRIFHLLVKEFLQLKRDKGARFRMLVPPMVQMLVFGYAATFDVVHVSTAILDLDRSQESRALADAFVQYAKTRADYLQALYAYVFGLEQLAHAAGQDVTEVQRLAPPKP